MKSIITIKYFFFFFLDELRGASGEFLKNDLHCI